MLKKYIKNIVKAELQKQKLNNTEIDNYKKLVSNLNSAIHQQNSELSKSYKCISSLKQENELLKEAIENLDGKLILKGNLLSEQKQENEKLKDILNEIHEICFSTWGAPLPYCEVRRLLNVIREISKIG